MQSLPFNISGIHAFWIPVGFLISMDASDATSHGETSRDAKLTFSAAFDGSDVASAPDTSWTRDGAVVCFALMREVVASGCCVGFSTGDNLLFFLDPFWSSISSSLEEYSDIEAISFTWCRVVLSVRIV